MGNSSKKAVKTHKQHNHPRLKTAKEHLVKNKSNIKSNFSVSSKQDLKEWENILKKSPAATAKHAFIPTDIKSKSGMCGSAASVQAEYPGYWYLLSDQIQNRKLSNREVDQNQIWQVLYSLSETATQYHKKNIKTGDIRPANVLLNDQGDSKLVTVDSWPDQETNYVKTLRNGEKTYLAPEQVRDVDIGRNKQATNIEDGQAFSLGLTGLDCALLENSSQLYPQKGVFDEQLLEEKRNRLQNNPRFSPELKATLLSLTDVNPNNRAVPGEIYNWLRSNQVQIYNNHPFKPSNQAPSGVSKLLSKNYTNGSNNQRFRNSQIPEYQTRYIPSSSANQTPLNKYQYNTQTNYAPRPSFHTDSYGTNQYFSNIAKGSEGLPNSYLQTHTVQTSNKFIDKPPVTIKHRYLPTETYKSQVPTRPIVSDTGSKYNLRDVYRSPDTIPRFNVRQEASNSYIPKSQEKDKYVYERTSVVPQKYNYKPSFTSQYRPLNNQREIIQRKTENQEQIDYNRPKVQNVAINRGSRQEIITAEVEEDYPERNRISNWTTDQPKNLPSLQSGPPRNQYQNQSYKASTPMIEVQQDYPQRPKMAYWNTNNSRPGGYQQGNSRIPIIHQASDEDSRVKKQATPDKSNIQPIQSVYESQEENYKISFFNNPNLPKNIDEQNGRFRANTGRQPVSSGYQRSPVIESANDDAPRQMIVSKKKKVHEQEDESEIREKMNAQTTGVYQYQ